VYGLPELKRAEIKAAKYVASPGCFATTIELALLPLARAGLSMARACTSPASQGRRERDQGVGVDAPPEPREQLEDVQAARFISTFRRSR